MVILELTFGVGIAFRAPYKQWFSHGNETFTNNY